MKFLLLILHFFIFFAVKIGVWNVKRCKTNVSSNLSEILGLPKYISEETHDWNQPDKCGLNNSNIIIPNYYIKSYSKLLDIDYFTIIKDDIKNIRPLNIYQLEFIKTELSNENIYELICLFNQCVESVNDIMLDK